MQRASRSFGQLGRLTATRVDSLLHHGTRSSSLSRPSPVESRPSFISEAPPKPPPDSRQSLRKQTFTTTANPSFPVTSSSNSQKETRDSREVLIDSCPLTPVDELIVAAHMARLSNICYVPEPREQLEALGLKLVAKGKTYFTAWYVADGPDLSEVQERAPLSAVERQPLVHAGSQDGGREKGGGGPTSENGKKPASGGRRRVRYILTHGVRWGASDLDSGRMWRQIMKCWPVDFPPSPAHNRTINRESGSSQSNGLLPEDGLIAHQGVLEIAEEVYSGVRPWLAGVEKGEVSAIRFGGHSLGGSVAALLMLLAKVRHGLGAGQVSAHLFGSPAVLARKSVAREASADRGLKAPFAQKVSTANPLNSFTPEAIHQTLPHGAINGAAASRPNRSEPSSNTPQVCEVLKVLGLPSDAVRSIVLDKDMVPRMFLAADPSYGLLLKSPLVRGLLEWREKVWGPGPLTQERFLFENVGLVHYIKTVGEPLKTD
jgi:hypothetical protein